MIFKLLYAPVPRFSPSIVNANSAEHARRLFGAGLSETDKVLIVVREVRPESTRPSVGRLLGTSRGAA